MPAESTASGISPTARSRNPKRVLLTIHQVRGTDSSAT
jgi:hypothetical protein